MSDKLSKNEAAKEYPAVAVNIADENRENDQMVKDEVKELNNNPRINDDKMP